MATPVSVEGLALVFRDLTEVVGDYAMAAVRTQQILDEATTEELAGLGNLTEWPDGLRSLQAPLLPSRLGLSHFSIELRAEAEITRERGFSIGILNAGFAKLSKVRAENFSRFEVEVEATCPPERNTSK